MVSLKPVTFSLFITHDKLGFRLCVVSGSIYPKNKQLFFMQYILQYTSKQVTTSGVAAGCGWEAVRSPTAARLIF